MPNSNNLFPVFLKLDQLTTLVVGGGNVGLEKVEALLKNDPGAIIKLVAPEIKDELWALAENRPAFEIIKKAFTPEDLEGVNVTILATDSRETNASIRAVAKQQNILVNVADTPDLCDFYLGSTVKKGNLKIGISTNGQSPTFAKRFREVLEDVLPEDTQELLKNLKQVRDSLKGDFGYKVKELNKITRSLVSKNEEK
ncbi:bifunctional precorrin-2 dehydrogenase/sirohydrochlorin ferrochelatase [Fulvivirga sp. M361]|uniref:precorrin-2 dehydrogenase/sirohydrochlorin ferrochelatase family protein n=1 Tax=Fulvivirga sp. M361 TaxID=2594266 RepID=UPI00117AF8E9|nr:bifunctional precorrin-2 dehydrogenase/sirohydrochlorin ferrochelatase [Fulvivirga sp. M361]TRX56120.1 bifunctional precorrin-2 dehydrogenase/sirohydrochlorin ferrochelatase [Fulvivirga sp. M361]